MYIWVRAEGPGPGGVGLPSQLIIKERMMKRRTLLFGGLILLVLVAVFAAGILVGKARGIPFVTKGEQWTIGIYSGDSPFELSSSIWTMNPVLTAEDVTDVPAKFVADPFLLRDGASWYLFFEVYNLATEQGDLAVATGGGGRDWVYQGIILDEPFHLSYPYVFRWEGDTFLVPETFEAESIRLYKAVDFPRQWEFVSTLVEGGDFVDPSLAFFNDTWWLFASTTGNETLFLFYSDDLEGPWVEHPLSPIVSGDKHSARPSGRVLVHEDRIYRFANDVNPPRGLNQVWAFEITTLTRTEYEEARVGREPVLVPHGSGWTAAAMHHVDPHQVEPGRWIAAVDGFGEYYVFGWRY